MTAPRLVQNFRGLRGVWLGPPGAAPDTLGAALARLGLGFAGFEEAEPAGLAPERDILFIDGDGMFDAGLVCPPGRLTPVVPVIGVVGMEAPSRLKALSDAGVTALLRKPIHPATVYSSLFLAVNNHARVARLEAEVEAHRRRRGGRRFVTKAVLDLMRRTGLSDDDAYAQLRRESMRRRMEIEDYARTLIEGRDEEALPTPIQRSTGGH